MTGAVDLIVVGDQFVNPSLSNLSRKWEVPIISAELLKKEKESGHFAREIVERAKKSFDFRRNIPRDIPDVKENAMMGFSCENVDVKKILGALNNGQLKGIAILSGSNNVKYTQDHALQDLESRAAAELRRAYEAIDQQLDVRRQARFRVFEQNMERRKLQLMLRARRGAPGQPR